MTSTVPISSPEMSSSPSTAAVRPTASLGAGRIASCSRTRYPTNESPLVSSHEPSSLPDGLDPLGTCTAPIDEQLTSAPADRLTAAGPPPATAENRAYPRPANTTIAATAIAIHPLRPHVAMPDALRSSNG